MLSVRRLRPLASVTNPLADFVTRGKEEKDAMEGFTVFAADEHVGDQRAWRTEFS